MRRARSALTAVAVMVVAAFVPAALTAQSSRGVAALGGSAFIESLHSDVVAQSASGQRKRSIDRFAEYGMLLRGDTLIVTVDSLTLQERDAGAERDVNVDAVIGARWKLVDSAGRIVVAHAPFVPDDIAGVSDVAVAMDDFFPVVPAGLAVNAISLDSSGTRWRRLADSAGRGRYRWNRGSSDSSVADSLHPASARVSREDGDATWQQGRGPVAWHRKIHTTVTTVIGGRPLRAEVDQQVTVRRMR